MKKKKERSFRIIIDAVHNRVVLLKVLDGGNFELFLLILTECKMIMIAAAQSYKEIGGMELGCYNTNRHA